MVATRKVFMLRNTSCTMGLCVLFLVLAATGCRSISTDALTFKDGLYHDATGQPFTGTAVVTVRSMMQTGIGMGPHDATLPCKFKIERGEVVAVKNSSSPFATWVPFQHDSR